MLIRRADNLGACPLMSNTLYMNPYGLWKVSRSVKLDKYMNLKKNRKGEYSGQVKIKNKFSWNSWNSAMQLILSRTD